MGSIFKNPYVPDRTPPGIQSLKSRFMENHFLLVDYASLIFEEFTTEHEASVYIENSTFFSNRDSYANGSAIFITKAVDNSYLKLVNNIFNNLYAYEGSAALIEETNSETKARGINLENNIFVSCHSNHSGGAISM